MPAPAARLLATLLLAGALASPARPLAAQDAIVIPPSRDGVLGAGQGGSAEAPEVTAGSAGTGQGGVVRVLDKINGTLTDLELAAGETAEVGTLSVTMGECRYPVENPAGDAFALVSIRTRSDETAIFEGWLIATAPALNAVDHPRYDVWALRCLGLPEPPPEPAPEGNGG
jgi:hypothetical protein